MNQIYYDAPAKLALLERALNKDGVVDKKVIEALIFRQKCILHRRDGSNSLAIYHPIHKDVRLYFESKIKDICGEGVCLCPEGCACLP
ncbi:MAG: hypothetical protein FWF41_09935 [Betaproteobacteria bacterium]|nr:hypothetical protein [Betaproteobacteria bacterium]